MDVGGLDGAIKQGGWDGWTNIVNSRSTISICFKTTQSSLLVVHLFLFKKSNRLECRMANKMRMPDWQELS